ncbi:MAG: hypothetical protein RMK29_14495 [Myxococcales bacterium]|nr:hypothetical protein [Myxococcota bacterium]MDW8282921.1 hypothetical protein [Myxococcales bacterium]
MNLDVGAKAKLVTDILCLCIQHSRAADQLPEPRRRSVVEENVARFLTPSSLDLNGLWATLLREPGVTERSLAAPFAVLEDMQGVLQVPMLPLQRLQALTAAQRQALVAECTVNRKEIERLVRQARIEAQLASARRTSTTEAVSTAGSQPQMMSPAVSLSPSPMTPPPARTTGPTPALVPPPPAAGGTAVGQPVLQLVPPGPPAAVPQGGVGAIPPAQPPAVPQGVLGAMPQTPMTVPGLGSPGYVPAAPMPMPLPSGPPPSGELLALGLTLADICLRLGPQDAEAMLRRLADLIRDHGLHLATAAASLPPPAPQMFPPAAAGLPQPGFLPMASALPAQPPWLPPAQGLSPLGSAASAGAPVPAAGLTPPVEDDNASKEARARAARALLDQSASAASAEPAPAASAAKAQTKASPKPAPAKPARDAKKERLKLIVAVVGMVVALASLGYVLFVDSASPIDLSFVTALQLSNGMRIGETVQATITDPRWGKMKPEEKKQVAAKVFQQVRAKGFRNLSLMNTDKVPEAVISDQDPNSPGGVSINLMGIAPPSSPSVGVGAQGGAQRGGTQGAAGSAPAAPSMVPSSAPSMVPSPPPP